MTLIIDIFGNPTTTNPKSFDIQKRDLAPFNTMNSSSKLDLNLDVIVGANSETLKENILAEYCIQDHKFRNYDPNGFNFCITHNITAGPRIPFTKWIIFHRFHHALLIDAVKSYYVHEPHAAKGKNFIQQNNMHRHTNLAVKYFNGMHPFNWVNSNAGRKGIINSPLDFYADMFAMWSIFGKIKPHPKIDPNFYEELVQLFEQTLDIAKGKIFVF